MYIFVFNFFTKITIFRKEKLRINQLNEWRENNTKAWNSIINAELNHCQQEYVCISIKNNIKHENLNILRLLMSYLSHEFNIDPQLLQLRTIKRADDTNEDDIELLVPVTSSEAISQLLLPLDIIELHQQVKHAFDDVFKTLFVK